MNFVERFINFTKEYESPTSFWRWAAYCTVAAVLRDKIYFNHGLRKTYPNIYVVLLADSAQFRKSGPFSPVVDLLTELQVTKLIIGRASVQGVLDDLSQNTGGLKGGSCLLCAEELASFFVKDPQLIPLITDIYDFKPNFKYLLRSGMIKINNLCVTLLAASNAEFLKEVYTSAAVYGGLLGRTLLIKPDETRPPNSLLRVDINKYDKKDLIDDLSKIRNLEGEVKITKDAVSIYELWYHALYNSYTKMPDRTGVTQRMHNNVLKLAMIIAASHYTLEINEFHIQEAIEQVTKLRSNYEVYAMSSGKSTQADIGALFLNSLWTAPQNKMTRQEFLFKNWHMVSSEELEGLIQTLTAAKLIDIESGNNGVIYLMTEKCKNIFLKQNNEGLKQ